MEVTQGQAGRGRMRRDGLSDLLTRLAKAPPEARARAHAAMVAPLEVSATC